MIKGSKQTLRDQDQLINTSDSKEVWLYFCPLNPQAIKSFRSMRSSDSHWSRFLIQVADASMGDM